MKLKNLLLITLIVYGSLILISCSNTADKKDTKPSSSSLSLNHEQVSAIENAIFLDFDGNEIHISDFFGKTVLIDFWETWCAPCIASMPTLERLMQEYPDDFVVLATSPLWTDTEDVVRRFINSNDYSFYFVHANDLASKLNIRGIPYKVYVAPDGSFYKDESGSRGPDHDYRLISQVIEKLKIQN